MPRPDDATQMQETVETDNNGETDNKVEAGSDVETDDKSETKADTGTGAESEDTNDDASQTPRRKLHHPGRRRRAIHRNHATPRPPITPLPRLRARIRIIRTTRPRKILLTILNLRIITNCRMMGKPGTFLFATESGEETFAIYFAAPSSWGIGDYQVYF